MILLAAKSEGKICIYWGKKSNKKKNEINHLIAKIHKKLGL